VLGASIALVLQAFFSQEFIDLGPVIKVFQPVIGLAHDPLAGTADGQYWQVQSLSHGKGAGV